VRVPPLREGSDEAIVFDALRTLIGRSKYIRDKVEERVQAQTGLSRADVRAALAALGKRGLVAGIGPSGDPVGHVMVPAEYRVMPEPPLRSATQRLWSGLVEERRRSGRFDDGEAVLLLAAAEGLPDLPAGDVEPILDGLARLCRDRAALAGTDPALVSARYLQGSAKLLGKLGRAAAVLGVAEDSFDGRPRYVVAAGPPAPQAVLFVENPGSLETLVALGLAERLLVIGTFGYGLTWSGVARAFGPGARKPATLLVRAGAPPDPRDLRGRVPFLHWGDLDHDGLRIFLALRTAIPELRLSALYQPMAEAITDPCRSHAYAEHTEKAGQRPLTEAEIGGDPLLASLAALCRERAVDQESVPVDQIIPLADQTLVLSGAPGNLRAAY